MSNLTAAEIRTHDSTIFVRSGGSGPPLLLLHGFPETHLMWRGITSLLIDRFTVVCADLRGYGRSGCPMTSPDHASYSKRAMSEDMFAVMDRLGFHRFSVAGHDRGGRVAYRMALDHPDQVERTAVLDVLPIETAWQRADARFALAFWPWSLLAQAEPLPERLLTAAPEAIVDDALTEWGTPSGVFPPDVRNEYIDALRSPDHAHAICEEYRAAATIDREHDRADRLSGRRIANPLFVIWSARGPLEQWFSAEGGPLALWREWAENVQGCSIDAGHFFPEEAPKETADLLAAFFNPAVPS